MGYINFLNFEGDKVVDSDIMNHLDYDDSLEMINPGDRVSLEFSVDRAVGEDLQSRALPGLEVTLDSIEEEGEAARYMVAIEFQVVERRHTIGLDWLKIPYGFRLRGTTISIKPDTKEGEEVFLAIQKERELNSMAVT